MEHLREYQGTVIVWFLVAFPVLVLGVFAWLVTHHHTKLYAPKDYQDASTFLRTLSSFEKKAKIEKEVDEIAIENEKERYSFLSSLYDGFLFRIFDYNELIAKYGMEMDNQRL